MYYTYDSDENLVSIELNSVEYYYVRNAQGDIIALIDAYGNKVVTYTYDSWDKILSIGGSLKDSLGVKNPYRYRQYRYDTETGLYYLQSRYYNPEWGRFINADSVIGETGDILSHNMFAYCMNDPVNNEDPDGDVAWWVGAAGGAVVDTAMYLIQNRGRATWKGAAKAAVGGAVSGVLFAGAGKIVKNGAKALQSAKKVSKVVPKKTPVVLKKNTAKVRGACFTEDTLILTKDGYKKIKDVKVRDEVYSQNAETGEQGLKKVKTVFVHEKNKLVYLYINGQKIETTEEHPFWEVDKGWVDAINLKVGDRVLLYSGEILDIDDIESEDLDEAIKVYNFEVEDWHTYFVSDLDIYVHNTCFFDEIRAKGKANIGESRRSVNSSNLKKEKVKFLGKNYVKVSDGKRRNKEGTRQFRAKSGDLKGHKDGRDPHVHFEFIKGIRVVKNVHVPYKNKK